MINEQARGKHLITIAPDNVTLLLRKWGDGDSGALEQLTPLVYDELHRLAHQHMRREKPGHMLQTTALVHEAYLRLIDQSQVRFENRVHFLRNRRAADASNPG